MSQYVCTKKLLDHDIRIVTITRRPAKGAQKREGFKVKTRIHAVLLFLEDDMDVADIMKCSENSLHNWIRRFDEASIDGLRDLPCTGRRPKIPKEKLDDIMECVMESDVDPVALHQNIIDATGTSYSLGQIRRIMHRYGLSRYTSTTQALHPCDRGRDI